MRFAAVFALLGCLAWVAPAKAQEVITYYAPSVPVTTYYAPSVATPVTTYYAPSVPVTTYYAPAVATPVTTYYAPSVPVTTYYSPSVAYYPSYYYVPPRVAPLVSRWVLVVGEPDRFRVGRRLNQIRRRNAAHGECLA